MMNIICGMNSLPVVAETRIRGERRLGEMLIEQKKATGLNIGSAGTGRPSLDHLLS